MSPTAQPPWHGRSSAEPSLKNRKRARVPAESVEAQGAVHRGRADDWALPVEHVAPHGIEAVPRESPSPALRSGDLTANRRHLSGTPLSS